MTKGFNLGEFEYLVLLAVLRLGEESYGMTVRRELIDIAGRDAGIGSVYQTLERLDRKGLVRSRMGPADANRGGKPRRHYVASAQGRAAAAAMRESVARMWDGIDLSRGRS